MTQHNTTQQTQQETTELRIQELQEDLKQDILQEEESNNRILSLNNGICVKCNKPLSRTTFRDINGEVEGWTSECLNCEILYEER